MSQPDLSDTFSYALCMCARFTQRLLFLQSKNKTLADFKRLA
jgi:hypothetical protein